MGVLSWLNDVLYDGLPYALTVMSFLITFRYLNFPDLTAAGSFVFGAAIAAISVVKYGINPFGALALAVVAGAAAGAITGLFHVALRIERLLAGILGAFLLYAVNQLLLSPTLPYGSHSTILSWAELHDRKILAENLPWHPFAIMIFVLLVGLVKLGLDWYLHSEVGLALRALEDTDAGEEVLQRSGLSPGKYRFAGVVMANALVGLSGAVISMREGAANAHRGFDVLVTGLVAYLVGVQTFNLAKQLAKRRTGNDQTIARWVSRVRPTSAAVFGTVAYFALVDLAQRIHVRPELARIVLVLFVVAAVGNWSAVRTTLRFHPHRMPSAACSEEASLLSLRSISFRYPTADERCIQNQTLEVEVGERLLLQGPNGSGKTTLMKIASGLLTPGSGEICLLGKDVTADSAARLRSVVYVDQNPHRGVVDTLTVEENLKLARTGSKPSLWRKADAHRDLEGLDHILRLAGFPPSHLQNEAASLSGGQRQITNLLTLLARENLPNVVLLDEPTNNLDAEHASSCKQIIEELGNRGVAVVLVSHSGLQGLVVNRIVSLPRRDDEMVEEESVKTSAS
jgi:putative ABC transport system permease protein